LFFAKKKKALLYSSVVQVSLIFIYAGHFFMIVDSKEQHCKTKGCAGFFLSLRERNSGFPSASLLSRLFRDWPRRPVMFKRELGPANCDGLMGRSLPHIELY
jgi:hypothetical protein